MQTIERILMVDGCVGTWTDAYGKELTAPELVIGIRARLRIDLRQPAVDEASGLLLPVDPANVTCDGYYIALDSDYLQETDPKLLKTSGIALSLEETEVEVTKDDGTAETVTITRTILELEIPNTAVPGLKTAVAAAKSVSLNGETGGYAADADASAADFAYQFALAIRNRVWLGEAPEEVANDPEYWNSAQVQAFVANYFRPEKGDQGVPGKSAYEVATAGGYSGTEAEWLASLNGSDGESAYEIAVAGGYSGTEAAWLESLKGEEGKNAYEVAVANGYTGTVEEWIASLKGERGDDLRFDATGELSERGAYDGESAGFTFGAAVSYPDEKKTELYVYVKKTSEWNDWCSPLVITVYARDGKDGENIALIEPLEFVPPTGDETYLYFSLLDYPAATIAAVCIDTAEGEYRLPYDSARGIQKIVKYADGTVRIYFGTLVPTYQTGRVYFAQGSAGLTQYQIYLAGGGTLTYEEWRDAALGNGDMKKSVYDTDADGIVDQAQTALSVGGKTAAEVAAAVNAAANIPVAGVDGGFAPLSGGKIPSQYLNANASTHVAATIAARDVLTPTQEGERAFVRNASGDSTVTGGAAEYIWDGSAWVKIAEAESLDLILDWGNLQNKPDTFPPESHGHAIADVSGLQTTLDGKAGTVTATAEANGLMSAADKTKLDGIDIVSDFNVTELDSDNKAAVASTGIVGVVDDNGVQWAITDEMIAYANGTADIDFSGILARKGISTISGTWRLIVSGGSGSSGGGGSSEVSLEQIKQEAAKAAIIFG